MTTENIDDFRQEIADHITNSESFQQPSIKNTVLTVAGILLVLGGIVSFLTWF